MQIPYLNLDVSSFIQGEKCNTKLSFFLYLQSSDQKISHTICILISVQKFIVLCRHTPNILNYSSKIIRILQDFIIIFKDKFSIWCFSGRKIYKEREVESVQSARVSQKTFLNKIKNSSRVVTCLFHFHFECVCVCVRSVIVWMMRI